MPTFVVPDKCDGCRDLNKAACLHICPNDLMALNKATLKGYNREPEMCWECYACVKICPARAIEVRGYADFIPLGANVYPERSSDSILWTVTFRNGTVKRFRFPTRATPEGSIEPHSGFPSETDDLSGPALFTG